MRLIDLDAFRADYELRENCDECSRYGTKDCDYASYSARDFCGWLDDAPIVDAIPIEPLCEWLAGYAAPPKYAINAVGGLREMADATKRAKAWEFALTSMERSGFLEVRVE